jgi:hypothetical protein
MVLLGDKAQLEAHFGLFADSANLDARLVHDLRQMYLLTLKITPSQHTSEGLGRPRGLTRPATQQETKRNRRNRSRDR